MDMGLEGKRAFVSGSTRGIGFSIAQGLLREGVAVVVNGRTAHAVEQAVHRLAADVPGADVTGIAADFSVASDVEALIADLAEVDILVNNAGVFDVAPFTGIADSEWFRYFEVNVMSGVRMSRALLPGMIESGWGRVLFVSSESGVNVPADMTHYGVTKAGTLALGNGLAKLTRGTGVTVNTILGGPTYSDGVARVIGEIADRQGVSIAALKSGLSAENRTSLLQRFIEPNEIANLAVYLASPLSSATNGAALRADGGTLTAIL